MLGLRYVFTVHYADVVSVLEPLWSQASENLCTSTCWGLLAHNAGQRELDEQVRAFRGCRPRNPEFHLILGKANLNREEPEKPIVELQRAESVNRDMPFLHFGLGVAYMRTNDNERAKQSFARRSWLSRSADIYEQLGEFYLKVGKDDEAEKEFEEASRDNPRMPGSPSAW